MPEQGRLMPLLPQSSTASEERPRQFHLMHLCRQMMDPHSHVVHWTFVRNYIDSPRHYPTTLEPNPFASKYVQRLGMPKQMATYRLSTL